MTRQQHISVMLTDICEGLVFEKDALFIDGTFGGGGYSRCFLEKGAKVIAFDRDPEAIRAGRALEASYQGRLTLIEDRFSQMEQHLSELTAPIQAIILDIGVSSMQIDQPERGFSFQKAGPLDMRMSAGGITAAEIVNSFSIKDLTRIFKILGEENFAAPIARMIEKRRQIKPFTDTLDLAKAIETMTPIRRKKTIHPATRVFQALRIYVNQELDELIQALFAAERLLVAGGRLGVVSFHSLEDRIVKKFLQSRSVVRQPSRHLPYQSPVEPSFKILFKGAKLPQKQEISYNKRARSAKLRMAVRTNAPPLKEDISLFKRLALPAWSKGDIHAS